MAVVGQIRGAILKCESPLWSCQRSTMDCDWKCDRALSCVQSGCTQWSTSMWGIKALRHDTAMQIRFNFWKVEFNEMKIPFILCQANRIFHTRWKGTKLPKSYPRNTYNVWRNTKTRIFTATRWDAACLLRGRGSWRRRRWGGREGGRVGKRFS